MRLTQHLKLVALSAGFVAAASVSHAVVVRHAHTNIPDVGGQDRWRTEISFEESTFGSGQGFSLLFDPINHVALASPSPVGPDWDLLSIQPDALLPGFGIFDGLVLGGTPDLSGSFAVEYTWLGVGEPETLPFVYYDADFRTLESGETVPEPGAIALGIGIAGMAAIGRRKHQSRQGEK